MIEQIKLAYRFLFVMGAGVFMLLLATLVPVLSTTADFSIYNTGWNGCSDLGKDVYSTGTFLPSVDISATSEEKVVHNTLSEMRDRLDPMESAIVIIGPRTGFSADEGRFIHDYMASGGIVLLADDFGSGNDLLSRLNTSTRFESDRMLDLSFMKTSEFAVTNDIASDPITANVSSILMNNPSIVRPAPHAVNLINSSASSWIDADDDELEDEDEEKGPFCIMSKERYGKGELLSLSDPSLMINQMKGRFDNGALVGGIISYISHNRTTLLIDESHRDLTDPVHVLNDLVGGLDMPYKVTALASLLAGFVIVQSPLPRRIASASRRALERLTSEREAAPPSAEEIIASVVAEHPDWDERLLRQLVKDAEV